MLGLCEPVRKLGDSAHRSSRTTALVRAEAPSLRDGKRRRIEHSIGLSNELGGRVAVLVEANAHERIHVLAAERLARHAGVIHRNRQLAFDEEAAQDTRMDVARARLGRRGGGRRDARRHS